MAAPTVVFRGSAVVEGVAGTYDALATNVSALNQDGKLVQIWNEEVLGDNHAYDFVWLMRNEHATLDITLYLIATTAAVAAVPLKVVTPAAGVSGTGAGTSISALGTAPLLGPGSILILTAFTFTAFNGSWRVLSGTEVSMVNSNAAKFALKLMRYANADQQTAMSTIPT